MRRIALGLLLSLWATQASPVSVAIPGPGLSAPPITQVYSQALTFDTTGQESNSVRDIIPSISTGGTRVRVTLSASSTATTSFAHMSVCVQSAGSTCVATPIELKVSGASGWTGTSGTSVTTDFAIITTVATNVLLVILDISGSNGNVRSKDTDPGGGKNAYRATASATYNSTTCAGCVLNGGGIYDWAVTSVEVQ